MPPLRRLYKQLHQVWPERLQQFMLPPINWCPTFASWTTQMLRESGFGANVFPLIGCNGVISVKVSFR